MSRVRENFPERLKKWLQFGGANAAPTNVIMLTDDMKAALNNTSPMSKRLKAIRELTEQLKTLKLETVRQILVGMGSGKSLVWQSGETKCQDSRVVFVCLRMVWSKCGA